MINLTPLQLAITQALVKLGAKQSPYSDKILAKEIRAIAKIENKKQASVPVDDIEIAMKYLEENGQGFWSIKLDSVNNILIKKVESSIYLTTDEKRNRLRSEKSMSLLSVGDFKDGAKNKKFQHKKQRKDFMIDDEN